VESIPAIDTVHQAFLLDLSELLAAERTFATAMPEMFGLAHDQQVKQALQQHIAETHQQIDNLDRAFSALDAQPAEIPCRAAMGLVADFRTRAQLLSNPRLVDGSIVASGLKAEHLEIAAYAPLVERAAMMGLADVARLLQENLAIEARFARDLEQLGRSLGKQVMSEHLERQRGSPGRGPVHGLTSRRRDRLRQRQLVQFRTTPAKRTTVPS
jgi:ferritin-like metal-binding protein YciE